MLNKGLRLGIRTNKHTLHTSRTYLDCNPGAKGKTGVGEIDYRNHDEELIEEDFLDENSLVGVCLRE